MTKEQVPNKEKVEKVAHPAKVKAEKSVADAKGKKTAGTQEKGVTARLFESYKNEAVPALMKKFQF